ncbi:hypothetical protein ABIE89_000707 [Bradyrhizobium niftali]
MPAEPEQLRQLRQTESVASAAPSKQSDPICNAVEVTVT